MTIGRGCVVVAAAAVLFGIPVGVSAEAVDTDALFIFAGEQLLATYNNTSTSEYPRYTDAAGSWISVGPTDSWTCGFFPQCLWAMYERTGDAAWRTRAETRTAPVEPYKNNAGTHDVGFVILNSFGYGYRLTGEVGYRDVCLTAAATLATRYNAVIGAIRSWDFQEPFPVIIDNMMNLELLFWSAANGGPSSHYDMALAHALTTRREQVRADGSTYHVVDYDPATGAATNHRTHAGISDHSTWSRGQAWGMYGFTMSYRYTGDARLLETAQLMSDWYIDHLPDDFVPLWDFSDDPTSARDSSAAAIAVSGLLELSGFVTGADRVRYIQAAESILHSLAGPDYLAAGSNNDAIVLHGTYQYTRDRGVDAGMIWGDAYFLEALLRYDALMASLTGGDADCDGDVDLDDFMILKSNFGSGHLWTEGEFTGDSVIDLDDFAILKQNFGATRP